MMGAGKKTQNSQYNWRPTSLLNSEATSVFGRNLRKNELGGVVFGCKNTTIKECLSKQLFGLPAQHFSYVKNIEPGLPLFLFNYSDRKLHGIFEAASNGKMSIDPYGWTANGSERTQYPAQVQICVRLQCQPLSEDKFRHAIADNYYSKNHFWFELDHAQTSKLISLLTPTAVSRPPPSDETLKESELFTMLESDVKQYSHTSVISESAENDSTLARDIKPSDTHSDLKEAKQDEKNLIFRKLQQLSLDSKRQNLSSPNHANDTAAANNMGSIEKGNSEATAILEKKEENPSPSLEDQYDLTQLVQEVKELTAFKKMQTERNSYLEQKLEEALSEIQHLRDRCKLLESASNVPMTHDEKTLTKSSPELHLDCKDSLFLIGGFDGASWLPTMDMYSTSQNVIKSLKPMSSVRSYASVIQLNGDIYVLGGGNGLVWYDTVESYNPICDNWTLCPSLNKKKGSLSGAVLDKKIFAVGGGNGVECFSDVEMLDFDIGRWITTQSMLEKRFALAAVELNGVLYATGGFDGNNYLNSAERFDPREHCWSKIPSMNTRRGCHSLVLLNEKLYALGGFDGSAMVPSLEVFDPRLGTWMTGEPMNHPRGYFAAAVVKESVFVIGGVRFGDNIVDTVESYKEGQGWQETCRTSVAKRCFLSAIACSHE